jgi:hypothetical protein
MVTGTQPQTAWAPWIRDLAEMQKTHLADIKHKGELKVGNPEPLACGRLLHATTHWESRWVATPTPPPSAGPQVLCHADPPSLHPTGLPGQGTGQPGLCPAGPLGLCPAEQPGLHFAGLLCFCPMGPLGLHPVEQPGLHLPACQAIAPPGFCPASLPGCCPPADPPAQWLPPAMGGLQHYQTPGPNLPERCRQTRLDANGVTPELLRLKFYCSWTGILFSFFPFSLFYKCLFVLFTVWLSTVFPCWFFWFSIFILFSPSFLVLLVLLL